MFEIQCLDSKGNTINSFTQWDINQKIIIPISGYNIVTSPDYNAPEVHFCNSKSENALVVKSETNENDNDTIIVDVPNVLLQEPYPLIVYVYAIEDIDNPNSERTILHNEIPIRKRVKPNDYKYVENITNITAEYIRQEIWKVLNADMTETFNNMQSALDAKTDAMQREIDTFEDDVNKSLYETEKHVNDELARVDGRLDDVNTLFEETTDAVNAALIEVKTATSNVEYMKDFVKQAEIDKEVYHVEEQTLYAENISVNQNLTVGNFIWVNNPDGNMSLKWNGGDINYDDNDDDILELD